MVRNIVLPAYHVYLLNQVWPIRSKQSGKGVLKMACTECINLPLTMKGGLLKCWMGREGGSLVPMQPPLRIL